MSTEEENTTKPETQTLPEVVEENLLEAAKKEIDQLKDHVLRAMAETENTRKRLQKEIADAQKYAMASFAKEMLSIADNFERAMTSVAKDKLSDDAGKGLLTGIEAIERQMAATFEKFGINKINALGQPFDPHLHRVMMEQEDLGKPAGTVLQVLQPGYMIGERLLREAMVVISKGGAPVHAVDQSA